MVMLSHESLDHLIETGVYRKTAKPLLLRQIELETLMRNEGIQRTHATEQQNRDKHLESNSKYAQTLLKEYIHPVTQSLTQQLRNVQEGQPGYFNDILKLVKDIPLPTIAYITLRAILNVIHSQNTVQYVAIQVSTMIENEARCMLFEQINSKAFQYAVKRMNQNTTEQRKSASLKAMMKHTAEGVYGNDPQPELNWEPWTKTQKAQLGTKLINIVASTVGLIEVVQAKAKNKQGPIYTIVPTQELKDWIREFSDHTALLSPLSLPCVISPRPYTTLNDGGYHTAHVPPLTLVKTKNKGHLTTLATSVEQMETVYQAVNLAQNTKWRVNQTVLAVAHALWSTNKAFAGLPQQDDMPLPHCPNCGRTIPASMKHNCFEDKTVFKKWKQLAAMQHGSNARAFSKRLLVHRILWTADTFKDDEAIYFPYQLDFRGRLYAVPQFLNPQGNDLAKGLLEFAEGKPITTYDAEKWLAIYAFLYGAGDQLIGSILEPDADVERQKVVGKKVKARFLSQTPALKRLIEDVKHAAKTKKYLRGLDGRHLFVRSEHSALNLLLQSAGALAMKKATVILWQDLAAEGITFGKEVAQMAHIHDEYQLAVRNDIDPAYIGSIATNAIRKAGEHFGFRCPLGGEYKTGANWSETH